MTELFAVLIDGVIYSSWLFIIAVGLTLVYGVMKIVNVAHGSLYALGAYMAATLVGAWTAKGYAPVGSLAMLLLAAVLVGAVMGPLIERGLLRFMYGKREVTVMLITYAVFLIMEDVVKLVWGVSPYLVAEPYALLGNVDMGAVSYPGYNVLLLGVSIAVGIALTLILTRTRQGKLLLAVIHDREVSTAMGINVPRFYLLTFSGGALLAAIGGAFTAPTVSVVPAMGVEVIVLSFAVIVIGGMGSLPGAALGAVIVGLVRSLAVHYWPEVELFSIYFVMAMVLVFRPKGLFGAAEVRKI
jgi:branched-chain amino acid transport system permease protein